MKEYVLLINATLFRGLVNLVYFYRYLAIKFIQSRIKEKKRKQGEGQGSIPLRDP